MKVTYISHSGFAVELPSATLLFDYYKGQIPAFPADKPLFVFASHSHGDHFVPQVFDLVKQYPQVHYIFSHDIWMMRKKHTRAGVLEKHFESATYMRAHETQRFLLANPGSSPVSSSANTSTAECEAPVNENSFLVSTLRSTDMGVAFLVECDGLRIYHAGDLHWWAWPGDTKQAANNMTTNYQREIAALYELLATPTDASFVSSEASTISSVMSSNAPTGTPLLDLAFLPLDGRLKKNYALGIEYFLQKISVRHVFPMHFWDKYEVITSYLQNRQQSEGDRFLSGDSTAPVLYTISHEYQSWVL